MGELEALVNIYCMFYRPILLSFLVNTRSVRPQFGTRLDFLEQEAVSLDSARVLLVDEVVGQFSRTNLFAHDQTPITEVRFVELYNGLQDMVFLRQVVPELVIPVVDGYLRQLTEGSSLLNRNSLGPAPQE